MYARYRTRSSFYAKREVVKKAYNVSPDVLRKPKLKEGLLHGIYTDSKVDLREKERLELLEAMRHPRERDFYQDHTYHNQWVTRDLEPGQKAQLASRYAYFAPDYEIKPWIWYPGDMVEVVRGEGAGQRGTIIAVVKYKNEILVQNVNVQDVVIPASETRPEQIVQREHPIRVLDVQHVDPTTNERCHLELVKVRNKETGALEEKRISLETGVLVPIPPPAAGVEVGDPLKDTALQDAEEVTYDAAKELPLLVERRLHAMEDYFVKTLKESYEFHEPLRRRNAQDMLRFQLAVVDQATTRLAERVVQGELTAAARATSNETEDAKKEEESDVEDEQQQQPAASQAASPGVAEEVEQVLGRALSQRLAHLPSWWQGMLTPYVVGLTEEAAETAEEQRRRAEEEAEEEGAAGSSGEAAQAAEETDIELEEDDEEEGGAAGHAAS